MYELWVYFEGVTVSLSCCGVILHVFGCLELKPSLENGKKTIGSVVFSLSCCGYMKND